MKTVIVDKLNSRTIEELKNDIIEAKKSTEEGSTMVFVLGLLVLEQRLSEVEYQEFEDSL